MRNFLGAFEFVNLFKSLLHGVFIVVFCFIQEIFLEELLNHFLRRENRPYFFLHFFAGVFLLLIHCVLQVGDETPLCLDQLFELILELVFLLRIVVRIILEFGILQDSLKASENMLNARSLIVFNDRPLEETNEVQTILQRIHFYPNDLDDSLVDSLQKKRTLGFVFEFQRQLLQEETFEELEVLRVVEVLQKPDAQILDGIFVADLNHGQSHYKREDVSKFQGIYFLRVFLPLLIFNQPDFDVLSLLNQLVGLELGSHEDVVVQQHGLLHPNIEVNHLEFAVADVAPHDVFRADVFVMDVEGVHFLDQRGKSHVVPQSLNVVFGLQVGRPKLLRHVEGEHLRDVPEEVGIFDFDAIQKHRNSLVVQLAQQIRLVFEFLQFVRAVRSFHNGKGVPPLDFEGPGPEGIVERLDVLEGLEQVVLKGLALRYFLSLLVSVGKAPLQGNGRE